MCSSVRAYQGAHNYELTTIIFLSFEIYNFIMLTIKVKSELDILASERKKPFTFLCLTHLSLLRRDQAEKGNS